MANIHPTAIVDPKAQLAESVSVGPYSIIGPHVVIGEGSSVGAHCVIEGHTTIGRDNRIYQFASLGGDPQDKKYAGEPTRLVIGDRNTIREFTTFNTGTVQDKGITQIGDDNWIMAYVHVAHDCVIGNHNVIANSVQFAGHVTVGNYTLIGGISGVHQFVRIGDFAMVGFQTRLSQDLPPFIQAAGNPAEAQNVHQEGPRRRGYAPERLSILKQMYRTLYRKGLTLEAAKAEIATLRGQHADADADIDMMLAFLADATRGIVR
ncbi:MAG TPA: acyl-ACP--UDP-N-acetylglucosamine O-acyltransferase [Aquabacterium sp.]|uniref:acyl-ACP--UDP-N-acetylglucosamine O-acyltransferase n=1 Tax=Aquabacterium sp. TaxID=1872578 RepID=UPI002E31D1B9|nr:acyl-ACP--UDP-N-acetylglucosamine O-acyltransferase [Aquabacterium sp.]HEX5357876.1 acyl-ACP--UDP-N-acetylglucosamine O-acyltransferase [Aquabacterium sp.]